MSSYDELVGYVKQLERRLAALERLEGAGGGVSDHGALTGLGDDDHSIYLLASAAGGRTAFGTNWTDLTDAGATTLHKHDHGGMDGLGDDDHSIYALLAGRSGGQSLIGGTAANDDLSLEGTSNATRDTSYVIMQPNGGNVGIGTTSPASYRLDVVSANVLTMRARSTQAMGSTSGGGIAFETSAQPTAANQRLGLFAWGADDGTNNYTPLVMAGFSAEPWSGSAQGCYFDFETTPNGANSRSKRMRISADGTVGIGTTTNAPIGLLEVNQTSTTAAIPSIALKQADLSEEFFEFNGTVSAGNPIDTAALGTYYGKIRVSVNGTFKYMPLYNS